MIDPDDPKQAKKYGLSGYVFMGSVIVLLLFFSMIIGYIYITRN
jgi:hypothetical protein